MPTTVHNIIKVAGTSFGLFCLSLLLAAYSARNPRVAQIGAVIVSELTAPFQMFSKASERGVRGIWENYLFLVGLREQNEQLKQRLSELEARNVGLQEFEHENVRLRTLLGIVENTELTGVVGRVIGYNPSNWVESVTIDRGLRDGVRPGMAVIEGEGVVGKVITAGRKSAQVLLITDHVSGIDAIIQRTRARGVVEGSGGGLSRMRYVLQDEDLTIGDRVITSGLDGVFPKGLLLGVVTDLDQNRNWQFQLVEVRPTVEFSRLETVLVIKEEPGVSELDKQPTG